MGQETIESNAITLSYPLEGRIGLHYDSSLPDSVMQSDLPQVEIEAWHEPIGPMIIGRISGPLRPRPDFDIAKADGTVVHFTEPRETQYVLLLLDGDLLTQRYDLDKHGEWDRIEQIRCSISEFIDQIEGFGESEETQAAQFRKVQRAPGTAMHTVDSVQIQREKRGAIPGFHMDHSGARAITENPDFIIPIYGTSFAFDISRREIVRGEPEELRYEEFLEAA